MNTTNHHEYNNNINIDNNTNYDNDNDNTKGNTNLFRDIALLSLTLDTCAPDYYPISPTDFPPLQLPAPFP